MNRLLTRRLLNQRTNLSALNHGGSKLSALRTSLYSEIHQYRVQVMQLYTRWIPLSSAYQYNIASRNMSSVSIDTTATNTASATTTTGTVTGASSSTSSSSSSS
mmetsp:Transcript_3163/g.5477  ORF Transcript_3163/g.5477 Transcript_3163/m.5477 type:complete len:104 (-) Transcript_3163:1903-2214(-)